MSMEPFATFKTSDEYHVVIAMGCEMIGSDGTGVGICGLIKSMSHL